jgi:hypothetical protein
MDTKQLARRGGWIAVAWGIIDPLATRLGIAAGLFTDFPGFSAWAVDKLGKAFAGMSADSAIILLGCLMLAWGWFGDRTKAFLGLARPSEPAMPGADSADHAALASAVKAIDSRLRLIEDTVAALPNKQQMYDDVRQVGTELQAMVRRVETLERDLIKNNGKTHRLHRGSLALLDHAEHALRLEVVHNLLRSAPDLENAFTIQGVTNDWLAEQTLIADGYLEQVTTRLGEARRAAEIRNVLRQAEIDTDRWLEAIPPDVSRPAVDPYRLRSYMIAKAKRDRAVTYLDEERQRAEKAIGYHLHRVLESLDLESASAE